MEKEHSKHLRNVGKEYFSPTAKKQIAARSLKPHTHVIVQDVDLIVQIKCQKIFDLKFLICFTMKIWCMKGSVISYVDILKFNL
jgi:hypothetical protein